MKTTSSVKKSRMEHYIQKSKMKSGLVAGISALLTILVMSLNIGGFTHLPMVFLSCGVFFLLSSVVAFIIGMRLSKYNLRWSIMTGISAGLICGFLILAYVVSQI